MDADEILLKSSSRKILLGDFGSGKTELALGFALQLKKLGQKVTVVDLDIVKPYFRVREKACELAQSGVDLIAPEGRLAYADLPILPDRLMSVFSLADSQVIMDVGGGRGAIVLGQLAEKLKQDAYAAWMVVNIRRPFTSDAEGIRQTVRIIERASRIRISGLISNTNTGRETTAGDVIAGLQVTESAGQMLGLPIIMAVSPVWVGSVTSVRVPLFCLQPRTQYPGMEDDTDKG